MQRPIPLPDDADRHTRISVVLAEKPHPAAGKSGGSPCQERASVAPDFAASAESQPANVPRID
jgi:hypothetical protein